MSSFDADLRGYDPSRVAAGVVTAVGFLGGGATFASGGKPHGLTTAAGLWGSAAAGLAAGVASFLAGLALAAITLFALQPLEWVARAVHGDRRREDMDVHVVVEDLVTATAVRRILRELDVRLADLQLRPFGDRVAMEMVLHGTRATISDALEGIRVLAGVVHVAEEAVRPELR